MPQKEPAVHSVHFYENHAALIQRLCGITASGLRAGNSVLIVATAAHRLQLVKELKDTGIDVRSTARDGRFVMFDAKETLSTFMVDDMPDADRFEKSVGELLVEAKKRAVSKDQGLTVFGEMVAVLWDEGKRDAALSLERMWNDTLNSRAFHLHCAYPRWVFKNEGTDRDMESICHSHSHVLVA
jgi:hypothetical protein